LKWPSEDADWYKFLRICPFSNSQIGAQFSNLWLFLTFSNRRPMMSLTNAITLTLTNKSATDLRIWKGRRFENTLKSDHDFWSGLVKMLIDINFYERINKNIDIGMQNNFLPCYSCHKVYDQIFIYDRLGLESRLKSASTPQISIHWCHYLKSWSDLRVFSNRRPFQILRSVADYIIPYIHLYKLSTRYTIFYRCVYTDGNKFVLKYQ
jgi:hypothetical protein